MVEIEESAEAVAPVMSENLAETLRRTTVVIEKAAKSLAAPNAAGLTRRRDTVDQFIGKPLVISFAVIVGDEFVKSPAEVPFPQWNHLVETLVLDRPHKPLRKGIAVWCAERRSHQPHA